MAEDLKIEKLPYAMPEPTFAVDGDTLAYRTAAVCEEHFEGACRDLIDKSVHEIVRATGISCFRFYLTSGINFRRFINKAYKANRSTMVHPKFLQYCKDYLAQTYGAVSITGFEADDCIATDMEKTKALHCGVDKDLLQISGRHYNYVKKEWADVTPEEAHITLYRQILTGDTSDNIKGLPRVGDKKAAALVTSHAEAYNEAMAAYIRICGESMPFADPHEYFIEQYTLVRMMREVPINYGNTYRVTIPQADLSGDFENLTTVKVEDYI